MNKSYLILIPIALGLLALIFFYQKDSVSIDQVYEISGRVVSIEGNNVVVTGNLKDLNSGLVSTRPATIKFMVDANTSLITKKLVITQAQIESGGEFTPEAQDVAGSFSELKAGQSIRVRSRDNLFSLTEALAQEIKYLSYNAPNL